MNIVRQAYQIHRDYGIERLFQESWRRISRNSRLSPILVTLLGDRLHEKLAIWPRIGYYPQLTDPRSFNEKVAHRKLYTDDDRFALVADKYAVRDYVRDRVGDHILNELYHVTNDAETIPFNDLPDEFVLKATHDSGSVEIVHDKSEEEFDKLRAQCRSWLEDEYGHCQHEYWYQEITPRIIIEELMKSGDGTVPFDYKFFVFHGRVEFVQVDQGRYEDHKRLFYDRDWNSQEFTVSYPKGDEISKPACLDEMIDIAESLGGTFDFARVDLYNPYGDEIRFGEITLAPGSGGERFDPIESDFELGSYW